MEAYLILSAALFCIGLAIILVKKNAVMVLMGVELILNAANLNLVAFGSTDTQPTGQMYALFVIVIAAAEVSVALAIVLNVYKYFQSSDLDKLNSLGDK
ncbi:NADH-quinone oxidoreductase subunit NuoK [Aureibacter tunicatorum]|uniref:NADH-quinone oxidoreductase subunit K n=1 Tax=Aureibacter tunicatorum TaxID=866807 RepID=A0AAE4BSF4_9BACT|nr:NADH-quinone oxidoreductase subunit NuoK [Aureibacter tunicatorum]MDR6239696.1 NADH:ubiquinone oxidoreductase subunit K [Aureibacter tunicatorum]BDD04172.1 NADH-quinone oxidoreductase subunit K [Aureibacter tunicatorum]